MPSQRLLAATAALLIAQAAQAQFVPPAPPRPFPGFLNEHLRSKSPYASQWDIGLNVRLRYEVRENAGFTDAGSNWDFSERAIDNNDNEYLLTRLMPRVGYTGRWISALVEGRSSYSYADERYSPTAPGLGLAERDGPMDLHQGFVMIGNHKEFPVSLKIGRQELAYGDQRLVGHFRWNNNARTFDAAKLRYQNAWFGVDAFTGGVVYNDHGDFNKANSDDVFSGLYFNFPNIGSFTKKHIVESYFLARNVDRNIVNDDWSDVAAPFRFPAPQDLYTAGVRIRTKPGAYTHWDYGIEAMYQFGNRTAVFPATPVAAARTAPRLDHSAYAFVGQVGYTFPDLAWSPRIALLYSYGSGDKSATDGESGTFQNLFPTNHLFYGYMDLNSLQNMRNLRAALSLKPTPTTSLAFEAHAHQLDRTTDFWYNVAGVPRNFTGAAVGSGRGYRINPSYDREIGYELDVVAGWWVTHWAQLEVGLSHYFRGDYVKQSLAAVGSEDASYGYLQLTTNF